MTDHAFADDESLARQLANDVAAALIRRLAATGSAALVVSGGRTPVAFLRELAARPVEWSAVHVTLADERCVPTDNPASNQRLVRDTFAGTPASQARLIEIDATATDAVRLWDAALAALPRPFAAVVLGMGDDGHFASLFPGMPGLALALDTTRPPTVVAGLAPTEPRDRLSLTLAALLDTDLLALHITGPAKLAVLQRASTPGSVLEMPVRALLRQRQKALAIYRTD
jgi:6-phosphogluconolactonase